MLIPHLLRMIQERKTFDVFAPFSSAVEKPSLPGECIASAFRRMVRDDDINGLAIYLNNIRLHYSGLHGFTSTLEHQLLNKLLLTRRYILEAEEGPKVDRPMVFKKGQDIRYKFNGKYDTGWSYATVREDSGEDDSVVSLLSHKGNAQLLLSKKSHWLIEILPQGKDVDGNPISIGDKVTYIDRPDEFTVESVDKHGVMLQRFINGNTQIKCFGNFDRIKKVIK